MYRYDNADVPIFVEAARVTDEKLRAPPQIVTASLVKRLARRYVLVEGMGRIYPAEQDADGQEVRTMRPLQVAAIPYRIAYGPPACKRDPAWPLCWRDGRSQRLLRGGQLGALDVSTGSGSAGRPK